MSNQAGGEQEPEGMPASDNTPPYPSYEQPEFYQQPQYYNPLMNAPGQLPYNANAPYGQRPYNYQQGRYSDPLLPPSNPLPLGKAIQQLPAQYWRVLTLPRAATFYAQQSRAAWNIIWVQIIALAVISAVLSALGAGEESSLLGSLGNSTINSLSLNPLEYGLYFLFGVPIGIFIGAGIYFLLAKAFGGRGTFVRYLYCFLLLHVPLAILSTLAGLVPSVNSLLTFAIDVYEVFLLILMTMAVHRLSGGKATLAVLILPIALLALVIIGIVIAAGSQSY